MNFGRCTSVHSTSSWNQSYAQREIALLVRDAEEGKFETNSLSTKGVAGTGCLRVEVVGTSVKGPGLPHSCWPSSGPEPAKGNSLHCYPVPTLTENELRSVKQTSHLLVCVWPPKPQKICKNPFPKMTVQMFEPYSVQDFPSRSLSPFLSANAFHILGHLNKVYKQVTPIPVPCL